MKTNQIKQIIQTAAVAACLTQGSFAFADMPRGEDVGSLAGSCNIGPFHQTSKAGGYNVLCNIMQDNEKCLAFIKGHFNFNGEEVTLEKVDTESVEKAKYCLSVLQRDLGLGEE